jgi:amino-acid N-acetyltransferase
MSVVLRRPEEADYTAIREMLKDAGLPVSDFISEHIAIVAEEHGKPVGAVGFERYGSIGLLRSLVVAEDARFRGLGRRLVSELEALEQKRGVVEIWLLTTDADPYFLSLGYETRERGQAPPDICRTAEFTELCPDHAVLMSKTLSD